MKTKIYLLVLLTCIIHVLCEQINFKMGQIIDQSITDENSFSKYRFDNATSLKLQGVVLSQESYKKIFSQRIPNLKSLTMSNININKKILTYIINAQFFPKLEQLELQNCNLDDQVLSVINTEKKVNITKLNLNTNYISLKGWRSLSNLKFQNKLVNFAINSNSLLYKESVDTILSYDISHMQNISLQKTLISGQQNIRLLSNMSSTLTRLDLSFNNYQTSFYEMLAKIHMPNLQQLKLQSINFDCDSAKMLSNWNLPKLKILDLTDNFVDDKAIQAFVTKKNMPNLKYLNISTNSMTGKGLQHLRKEEFKFVDLRLKTNKIVEEQFLILAQMDLSELKALSITDNLITTQNMNKLLNNIKITDKLEQLYLNNLPYVENILQMLPYSKLQNLKQLGLNGHDLNTGFQQFLNQSFNQLDYLVLDTALISDQNSLQLLSNLNKLAPKLTRLKFYTVSNVNITFNQLQINSIPQKCTLIFDFFEIYKENQTLYLISLDLNEYVKVHCPSQKIEQCFQQESLASLKKVNYKKLQKIVVAGDPELQLIFFKMILDQTKQLPYLSKLTILLLSPYQQPQILEIYQCINQFTFPSLKEFALVCESQKQLQLMADGKVQNYIFKDFFSIFDKSKLKNIKSLFINSNVQKEFDLVQFMQNLTLPYLDSLVLSSCRLQQKDMIQITKLINEKGYRIRDLDVSGNFIEQNLDEILANLTLKTLDISNIQIGSNFYKLASMSTQFLRSININSCFINDQILSQFVKKKKQFSQGTAIFPIMSQFIIGQNDFANSFKDVLEAGIPYLQEIQFPMSQYPDIFNHAFSSKCYRLQTIAYSKSSINQFYPNLDSKTTRRITSLVLVDTFLSGQDIQTLSKLQFPRLISITLQLDENITCQSLKYLLNIISDAKQIVLALKIKESQYLSQLNDNCINVAEYSIKRALKIILISEYQMVYLPKFSQVMLNSLVVPIQILMQNIGVDTAKLTNFAEKTLLNHLITLTLKQCNLDDTFISKILSRQLEQLMQLDLSNNKKLTHKALIPLGNKILTILNILLLSSTNIGNEGIQILSSSMYFFLRALFIANTNITSKGLQILNSMNAPQMQVLSISKNDLTEDDIVNFYIQQNFPLIMVLDYQGKMSYQNYEIITQKAQRNNIENFQLKAQIYYHEEPKNYAKLQSLRND